MEKLGIIGCGTMGHTIALMAAWARLPVTLHGINKSETERAQKGIMEKLSMLSRNGLLDKDKIEPIKNSISITHSIDEIAAVSSFIIEAIPENIDLKRNLFFDLDKLCGAEVILATNTSGLSTSAIAAGTSNPQRIIATHFWNPAHLIPLVEVGRGEKTNDETVRRAFDLLKYMKKKPIEVKKEVPGFVGNRLQFALLREAFYLLEQGVASKEDIDAAVTYGIGRRLSVTGPLVSADMGGLDVYLAITDYLFSDLSNSDRSSSSLHELVEHGKFGAKTGEGYYKWDSAFLEETNQRREKELIHFLKEDAEKYL
ncbi:MAG: 3-hydroxyacyl-CoA dehydrogenase NAD-binding domain-containing protein [Chitinophagaceae bacterium]